MKATLTLTQDEIKQAVTEYVARAGWKVGSVSLSLQRGFDGGRGESCSPDVIAASANVERP